MERVKPTSVSIELIMAIRKDEEKLLRPNPKIKHSKEYALQRAMLTFEPREEINEDVMKENEMTLSQGSVYGIVQDGKVLSMATAAARLSNVWLVANVVTSS